MPVEFLTKNLLYFQFIHCNVNRLKYVECNESHRYLIKDCASKKFTDSKDTIFPTTEEKLFNCWENYVKVPCKQKLKRLPLDGAA